MMSLSRQLPIRSVAPELAPPSLRWGGGTATLPSSPARLWSMRRACGSRLQASLTGQPHGIFRSSREPRSTTRSTPSPGSSVAVTTFTPRRAIGASSCASSVEKYCWRPLHAEAEPRSPSSGELHAQRQGDLHGSRAQNAALRCTASYRWRDRHACGLRAWCVRGLHSHCRRRAGPFLLDARSPGASLRHPHRRGTRTVSRPALSAAGSLPPPSRSAVWFLYRRYPHVAACLLVGVTSAIGGGVERGHWWPPLPLRRLCPHSRGGARGRRHAAPGVSPCLILERAFLQASPAIRTPSPLSTATFG